MVESNASLQAAIEVLQRNAEIEQGISREALKQSRAALELGQRARVDVDSISRVDLAKLDDTGEAQVVVTLRNFGNVPATDMYMRVAWLVHRGALPNGYAGALSLDHSSSRIRLSSRSVSTMTLDMAGVTKAVVAALRKGEVKL
jgi:hypothetical protein